MSPIANHTNNSRFILFVPEDAAEEAGVLGEGSLRGEIPGERGVRGVGKNRETRIPKGGRIPGERGARGVGGGIAE